MSTDTKEGTIEMSLDEPSAQAGQDVAVTYDTPSLAVRDDAATTPMEMLSLAVERGAGIDVLSKLMDLQERWDRNKARKAFDGAMAAARAEIPVVTKNRKVDFVGKTGVRTNYEFEDLAGIAKAVDPVLARHGLSYRYRVTSPANEPVTVTCIVSHRDGHSEENTLSAGRDDSGNKNSIQAVGSAITYLQRYTLKASLGLAAAHDDDGNAADKSEAITPEQVREINGLVDMQKADIASLLSFLKVERLEDLPAKDFGKAIYALGARRPKKEEQKQSEAAS